MKEVDALARSFKLVALALMLPSCVTPRFREFDRVQEGMPKWEVLDAAGSPSRTQRWQGRDRWIYVMWDAPGEKRRIREVHFEDGLAVYVGPQVKEPKVLFGESEAAPTASSSRDFLDTHGGVQDNLGTSQAISSDDTEAARELPFVPASPTVQTPAHICGDCLARTPATQDREAMYMSQQIYAGQAGYRSRQAVSLSPSQRMRDRRDEEQLRLMFYGLNPSRDVESKKRAPNFEPVR